jgi:Domain of unknown function (DUF2017)
MIRPRRRIEALDANRYRLELPAEERAILRALPAQLRALLDTDDPSLVRLRPPAYDEPEADAEYELLVGGEIAAGRHDALRILEETADAEILDAKQIDAWLRALNDLRLVLGTRLGVTEEFYADDVQWDDPRAPELALYQYLSWLQEQAVEAVASSL